MSRLCVIALLATTVASLAQARPGGAAFDPFAECAERPNGAFLHNPADCQAFFICSSGLPINGRCPNGYNFNPGNTLCELPEFYQCPVPGEATTTTTTSTTTTTTTTTTEAPTAAPTTAAPTPAPTAAVPTETTATPIPTTAAPLPTTASPADELTTAAPRPPTDVAPPASPAPASVCRHRPNGYFVNNPANCQAYFVCYNGEAHDQSCPPDLNFHEDAQLCDHPANFPCSNDNASNPVFNCPAAGIHLYAIENSCTDYRFCFGGFLAVRQCAPGLLFDERLNRCNFAAAAGCTRGLCPPVNDPANVVTHVSHEHCDDFYICYAGQLKKFSCAPGLHWNQRQQHCDFPHNVRCHLNDDQENSVTPPPPPTTAAPASVQCPARHVPGLHIIAHPTDCGRYFICAEGAPVEQTCPDDLAFDPAVGACNKPERFECLATIEA